MRYLAFLAVLTLSACGLADVGSSAATAGKLQADQAKQGQQDINKVQNALQNAAQQQEQQLKDAEKKSD